MAQLIRHSGKRATERPAAEPCSYEAEAHAIQGRYGAAIDAAHRSHKSRHEIEGIIRALRDRQQAELFAMRQRRRLAKAQPV